MIKGVAHNAFTVSDMNKSLDFYCDKLGLKKVFEIKDNMDKPWIVYLQISNEQFIELFYGGVNEAKVGSDIIGYHHFCFEVEDIYATAKMLEEKGVVLDSQPGLGLDHNINCWATDPDGNGVEFVELKPESPHLQVIG